MACCTIYDISRNILPPQHMSNLASYMCFRQQKLLVVKVKRRDEPVRILEQTVNQRLRFHVSEIFANVPSLSVPEPGMLEE